MEVRRKKEQEEANNNKNNNKHDLLSSHVSATVRFVFFILRRELSVFFWRKTQYKYAYINSYSKFWIFKIHNFLDIHGLDLPNFLSWLAGVRAIEFIHEIILLKIIRHLRDIRQYFVHHSRQFTVVHSGKKSDRARVSRNKRRRLFCFDEWASERILFSTSNQITNHCHHASLLGSSRLGVFVKPTTTSSSFFSQRGSKRCRPSLLVQWW